MPLPLPLPMTWRLGELPTYVRPNGICNVAGADLFFERCTLSLDITVPTERELGIIAVEAVLSLDDALFAISGI